MLVTVLKSYALLFLGIVMLQACSQGRETASSAMDESYVDTSFLESTVNLRYELADCEVKIMLDSNLVLGVKRDSIVAYHHKLLEELGYDGAQIDKLDRIIDFFSSIDTVTIQGPRYLGSIMDEIETMEARSNFIAANLELCMYYYISFYLCDALSTGSVAVSKNGTPLRHILKWKRSESYVRDGLIEAGSTNLAYTTPDSVNLKSCPYVSF